MTFPNYCHYKQEYPKKNYSQKEGSQYPFHRKPCQTSAMFMKTQSIGWRCPRFPLQLFAKVLLPVCQTEKSQIHRHQLAAIFSTTAHRNRKVTIYSWSARPYAGAHIGRFAKYYDLQFFAFRGRQRILSPNQNISGRKLLQIHLKGVLQVQVAISEQKMRCVVWIQSVA